MFWQAPNGNMWTCQQFLDHFGGVEEWNAAPPMQRRLSLPDVDLNSPAATPEPPLPPPLAQVSQATKEALEDDVDDLIKRGGMPSMGGSISVND